MPVFCENICRLLLTYVTVKRFQLRQKPPQPEPPLVTKPCSQGQSNLHPRSPGHSAEKVPQRRRIGSAMAIKTAPFWVKVTVEGSVLHRRSVPTITRVMYLLPVLRTILGRVIRGGSRRAGSGAGSVGTGTTLVRYAAGGNKPVQMKLPCSWRCYWRRSC